MIKQAPIRLALAASTVFSIAFFTDAAFAQAAASQPVDRQTAPGTEASAGQPAATAETQQGGLEDIVVTARRKSESLISVPVAVTAVDAATLRRANVNSLESAAAIVPFVTIARVGSGNGGFMSIRGIASTPQDAGAQQSVLTNIDNVLVGRGRLSTMAMFDIAQVEVLKGPQALYYGKNTTAGVFSIYSVDPGSTLGGYVRGGYEFEAHQRYIDAAIDIPLTGNLDARVAGHYSNMRGYVFNAARATPYPVGSRFQPWINAGITTAPGASNHWGPSDEDAAGRLTLVYKPTSALTAKLKYTYAHQTNGGSDELYLPYCRPGFTGVTSAGLFDPYSDCNRDYRISSGDLPQGVTNNSPLLRDGVPYSYSNGHLASLDVDYQLGKHLKLSSITGYYNVLFQGSGGFSPSVWAAVFSGVRERATGISQEIRLASDFDEPVNFEVGGFVDRLRQNYYSNTVLGPAAPDPATGRFVGYDRVFNYTSHSYSIFGRINWNIVENLILSGGVRYTDYKLNSTDGNSFVSATAPLPLRAAGDYFVRKYSDTNYSPEITLTWHPGRDQTLYLAYKTGYKSGGFSYPSILRSTYTSASTSFRPERAQNLEVGYKAELLDRRLRVELTGYRTTVSDQQLSSFVAADQSFFITNAGKSRVEGVELQLTAAVTDGLRVFGSVGYNSGRYLSFQNASCKAFPVPPTGCTQDLSGRVLPRAPKWAGNFGVTYDVPLGSNLKLSTNGTGTFSSSYYTIDSLDPNTIQKSYIKWDAGIAIGTEDDKYRLALQGRNLTNKYVTLYSYDGSSFAPGTTYISVPQRGRQISLEATVRF